ncbi:MAG TPA: hypothetical protein VLZ89_00215 [Anaerolineales bacterium]|nr:hypothetical protein [Anaerolineales bacterium]
MKPLIALIAIFVGIAACTGSTSAVPTTSPVQVATVVAATMEAIHAQATPTAIAATLVPSPTPPLLPPTPVLPAATRINFLADATAGVVTGTIQPGQSLYYVLNAMQGQPMIAMVDSYNHDVTMTIKTAGGTSLLTQGQNLNALLPVSEDYYITVTGGASTEDFTLTVETPARISFAIGKDNAIVSGTTAGGYVVSYVLFAQQDQNMEVDLNGVGKNAALTIYGFSDGQPYIRSVTGATTFSMKLPVTQDYIIDIVPQAPGMAVNYTLVVTVK